MHFSFNIRELKQLPLNFHLTYTGGRRAMATARSIKNTPFLWYCTASKHLLRFATNQEGLFCTLMSFVQCLLLIFCPSKGIPVVKTWCLPPSSELDIRDSCGLFPRSGGGSSARSWYPSAALVYRFANPPPVQECGGARCLVAGAQT